MGQFDILSFYRYDNATNKMNWCGMDTDSTIDHSKIIGNNTHCGCCSLLFYNLLPKISHTNFLSPSL
jgi:hypothetical protein